MTPHEIAAERLRRSQRKIDGLFPDTGPLRRELYTKHLEFFRNGEAYSERLFMAGNRCGKTTAGAYETTLHLTGRYPHWWEGRRFDCPIEAWVAGLTSNTTRDIVQLELLGRYGNFGTGMIPFDTLEGWTLKGRPAHAVDTVEVKHVSGGTSMLGFKAYREGAAAFQGTAKHWIWFDEEPELAVYVEACVRTMIVPRSDRSGLVAVTFTPLNGWSELVSSFLKGPTQL